MKILYVFLLLVGLGFFSEPAYAAYTPNPGGGSSVSSGLGVDDFATGAEESRGLTNTLLSVAHYALYVFYLLGVVFMGVAAIKFKNGDMEAMGKNLGGAVFLFLTPKIVEVLLEWASR